MTRRHIESELGDEIQCAKCGEFWPADKEFFYVSKGRLHSWCKACYVNDPKTMAKVKRFIEKTVQARATAAQPLS